MTQNFASRASIVMLLTLISAAGFAETTTVRARTDDRAGRDRLITLQITFQDGTPATVTVREDGMAVYENLRFGVKLGIVPHVIDAVAGDVDLSIMSIAGEPGAQRPVERLETLRGKVGFRSVTSAVQALPLEVSVVEVKHAPALSPARMQSSPARGGPPPDDGQKLMARNGCCVVCGTEMICGCAVASDCGDCCGCTFCQ